MSKAEKAKEKIIEATVKVAMDKGFANTRTAEIARIAGVSEGLIFKYFPTKNHLFSIIINDNISRIINGVEEIINDRSLDPTAKLISLINFHFNFFTVDRNIVQLIFGHSERKSLIDVESVIQQGVYPYVQLVVKIINEGIANGEFRPFNPEVSALMIIGSMHINLVNSVLLKSNDDLEQVKKELIEIILTAIKR